VRSQLKARGTVEARDETILHYDALLAERRKRKGFV